MATTRRKRTDVFSKLKRSEIMGRILGTGNATTELALVKIFKSVGIKGWRRHLDLPGKPDFTFPKAKVCVFVNGCFWHGCPKCYRLPKSNTDYWSNKISRNKRRDRRVIRQLRSQDYSVTTLWECSLSATTKEQALSRLLRTLSKRGILPDNI